MRRLIMIGVVGSLGLCLIASRASADEQQGAVASKPPPATAPDLLAGPKVEAEATQQRNNPGRPNAGNDQKREMDIPFQQWVTTLRGLGLSQEQQDKARSIVNEFQQATRDFQNEHGEDMRQLFGEMREARQSGKEPAKDSRDKLKQFEDSRPKPDAYKQRIWDLLNEQQQGQMKEKLESMRQQMMEKRNDRRDARRPGNAEGMTGPGRSDKSDPMSKPDSMNDMSPDDRPRDEMNPKPKEMAGDGAQMSAPAPNRPRAAAGQFAGGAQRSGGLNAIGRRRMEFLTAHQSADRQGWAPTDQQRRFEFDESGTPTPGDAAGAAPEPRR
jgi:hypothetical protein